MEIGQIILATVVSAIIIIYLQSVNKEMAMIASIVCGIILLSLIIDLLYTVLSVYSNLVTLGGFGGEVIKVVVKITLICYIVEFAVSLIEDFGLKSIADKLSLIGKIFILITATPIISSLIENIKNLIINSFKII